MHGFWAESPANQEVSAFKMLVKTTHCKEKLHTQLKQLRYVKVEASKR